MPRKVKLYIAVSLDGYIADIHGGVEWLDNCQLPDYISSDYDNFIQTVDTIIMGKTTYTQVVEELSPNVWPYKQCLTYVLTHQTLENKENIIFYRGDIVSIINDLKQQSGKDIWICGGANVIEQLLKEDLIDIYHLTVAPILLGEGIRLFTQTQSRNLDFVKSYQDGAFVNVVYTRKRD